MTPKSDALGQLITVMIVWLGMRRLLFRWIHWRWADWELEDQAPVSMTPMSAAGTIVSFYSFISIQFITINYHSEKFARFGYYQTLNCNFTVLQGTAILKRAKEINLHKLNKDALKIEESYNLWPMIKILILFFLKLELEIWDTLSQRCPYQANYKMFKFPVWISDAISSTWAQFFWGKWIFIACELPFTPMTE